MVGLLLLKICWKKIQKSPNLLTVRITNVRFGLISALRNSGADMSSSDYDRRTPLHLAACEGNLKMVKYLMEVNSCVLVLSITALTVVDTLKNQLTFRRCSILGNQELRL